MNAQNRRPSEWFLTIFCKIEPRRLATKYPALLEASTEPIPLYVTLIFAARIGIVGPINSRWKPLNIKSVFSDSFYNENRL